MTTWVDRLLDDRPTEIWYSWHQVTPSNSQCLNSGSNSLHQSTPAARLTTYEPPSSTYKPINVPLPPKCRAGETWILSLFSPPEGTDGRDVTAEGMIPLRKGEIVGVQSMGIDFFSSSAGSSSAGRPGSSSKPLASKKNGKAGAGLDKTMNGKKGSAPKQVEGPKQTRITRSWVLPSVELPEAEDASAPEVSQADSQEDEKTAGARRSIKRDSEGVPIVRDLVWRDGLDEQTSTDNPEPKEDGVDEGSLDKGKGVEVLQERRLRVIEETSFDLDKASSVLVTGVSIYTQGKTADPRVSDEQKIWDSGLALTSYLLTLPASSSGNSHTDLRPVFQPPADLMDRLTKPNSRILEIGAGSGLVGIGWAASGIALGRGSRVMITDLRESVAIRHSCNQMLSRVAALGLVWSSISICHPADR